MRKSGLQLAQGLLCCFVSCKVEFILSFPIFEVCVSQVFADNFSVTKVAEERGPVKQGGWYLRGCRIVMEFQVRTQTKCFLKTISTETVNSVGSGAQGV